MDWLGSFWPRHVLVYFAVLLLFLLLVGHYYSTNMHEVDPLSRIDASRCQEISHVTYLPTRIYERHLYASG